MTVRKHGLIAKALLAVTALVAALSIPVPALAGHGDCVIDVTPEDDTNVLGQTHTLTATLRPAGTNVNATQTAVCASHDDVTVNFEVSGNGTAYTPSSVDAASSGANDLSCTIRHNRDSCTVSYSRTATAGDDTIVASLADAAGVTDAVGKEWTGGATAGAPTLLNITPETDTNPLDTAHTLTATARDAEGDLVSGALVDFEVMDGPNEDLDNDSDDTDLTCTTGSGGTCTVSYTDSAATSGQIDTICGWLDTDNDSVFNPAGDSNADADDCDSETNAESEGSNNWGSDVTDRVLKTWSSSTPALLNVTPETDSNPVRTAHTLTATVRESDGDLVTGAVVDFEVMDGPNEDIDNDSDDVDLTCTTGSGGTCTVSYTDTAATQGQIDTICGWIDTDNDSVFNPAGDSNSDADDCDAEANTESEGSSSWGTDLTDRVTKTWSGSSGAIYLNVTPETDENEVRTEHDLTATARDANGATVSGVDIDFEITDGPNEDQDAGDADMSCTTGSSGTCSVSYEDDSAVPGDVDEICAWLDADDDEDFDDGAANADGGDCDAEDDDETEDSARTGTDAFGNDVTDVVTKDWVASSDAFYLNVTPESEVNSPRTAHTLSAVARDEDGNLAEGVSVDFEVLAGPNANLDDSSTDADLECLTDSDGECEVTYTDGPGDPTGSASTDRICAWLDIEDDDDVSLGGAISDGGACDEEVINEPEDSGVTGADVYGNDATDLVHKTWRDQQLPDPCESEDAIVGTDGPETLVGTAGNDIICGLGGGDSILGYGGNDLILAGAGADNVRGGAGGDTIRGAGGEDTLVGQRGEDSVYGGDGKDYVLGSAGPDSVYGGPGDDVLDGGRGVDFCSGGAGRDRKINC